MMTIGTHQNFAVFLKSKHVFLYYITLSRFSSLTHSSTFLLLPSLYTLLSPYNATTTSSVTCIDPPPHEHPATYSSTLQSLPPLPHYQRDRNSTPTGPQGGARDKQYNHADTTAWIRTKDNDDTQGFYNELDKTILAQPINKSNPGQQPTTNDAHPPEQPKSTTTTDQKQETKDNANTETAATVDKAKPMDTSSQPS